MDGPVRSNETPSEWRDQILPGLTYFKENDLLPSKSAKHLFHARRLIRFSNGTSYAPENGFAICHLCNQLVFEEFEKVKQKSESQHSFNDKYALHYYKLWMQNAIRRIKRAREVGKKIRAVNIISQKWLEYMYRPEGMTAKQLALHYQLLWTVREEMHQINSA
ncbi:hypothetical protein Glove_12g27 [Diversispora epigaea]|uniref:Uncharacterized protein n=1 Tax=Diversispora epigaea TaxID=1348612 RepID=A0A397JQQ4_9GLOM|nr:hypothetical protein Glove_12g27 [Diversispora epigaea]